MADTKEMKELKDNLARDRALFGAVKTEKDVATFIANKMQIGATDATLNRQLALLSFELGRISKGNSPINVEPHYIAYNAKARTDTSGRKVQSEKTVKTMVSYYNSFSSLGFVKGWDPSDVAFPWILKNVTGGYGDRGAFIRKVSDLTAAPSEEELAAMFEASKTAPKLGPTAKRVEKMVSELVKAFPDLKQEGVRRKRYAELIMAARNFVAVAGDGDADDALADILADAA